MSKFWTEEKKQKLREMWPDHSASEIAEAIGHPSRKAVIGAAHRMDLPKKLTAGENGFTLSERSRALMRKRQKEIWSREGYREKMRAIATAHNAAVEEYNARCRTETSKTK